MILPLISVAAAPSEGADDLDWRTRTQYRTLAITEDFMGDMARRRGEDVTLHE
ncbi:MAG: hypothetical protein GWP91_10515 [Rhodobacterales bacterium]|nr:hypothetical protein [Rhodobacterales bacterium]